MQRIQPFIGIIRVFLPACEHSITFCFSDTNAFYEQKLKARQAFEELMRFYNVIKSVNGLMITVWHNHFLGTDPRFAGWKEVYEIFLKDEVYWEG